MVNRKRSVKHMITSRPTFAEQIHNELRRQKQVAEAIRTGKPMRPEVAPEFLHMAADLEEIADEPGREHFAKRLLKASKYLRKAFEALNEE